MDTITNESPEFDVIVQVCDFHTRSKNAKKSIDKDAFIKNVLNNEKWQKKLADGHILGLFTHLGRNSDNHSRMIPYEDNISISPYLCNVTKKVWIEDDNLYAGIKILDEYEYGRKLKYLIKSGILVPVSMSVKAYDNIDKYFVEDLIGIDFTFRPDLEAKVIKVNFSEGSSTEGVYSFSVVPDSIRYVGSDEATEVEFSEDELDDIELFSATDSVAPEVFTTNFSLIQYIKEMKYTPAVILRTRIRECINYIKTKKQAVIDKDADIIKQYINTYILQFLQSSMSNPNTKFNIILGLQLNRYVKDRTALNRLQRALMRAKQQLLQTGLLPKMVQTELNESYQAVLIEIFKYINSMVGKLGKSLPIILNNTEVVPTSDGATA